MTCTFNLCALISLQIIPMWWFNWIIYLCLLSVLLLCPLRYVWFHADLIFLWIHGLHMLWFLLDAWNCWIPCIIVLCPSHIPIHQVRVGILSALIVFISQAFCRKVIVILQFCVLYKGSWVGWVYSFQSNLSDHKRNFFGDNVCTTIFLTKLLKYFIFLVHLNATLVTFSSYVKRTRIPQK